MKFHMGQESKLKESSVSLKYFQKQEELQRLFSRNALKCLSTNNANMLNIIKNNIKFIYTKVTTYISNTITTKR